MSATQRSKRKTASRVYFDEEDGPLPAKKKTRLENEAPHANGKPIPSSKKSKAVYEEERDGFTFSRASKGKKTQTTTATRTEPIPSINEEANESATMTSARKTKSVAAVSAKNETLPKRRRSARLSGDKEPITTEDPIVTRPKKVSREPAATLAQTDRGRSPAYGTEGVDINKRRDGTKIALPFADTPVIKRNKEMRAQTKGPAKHRRSSAGIRGRRASSLIESGTSNGRNRISLELQDSISILVADGGTGILLHDSNDETPSRAASAIQGISKSLPILKEHDYHEIKANELSPIVAVPHTDVEVSQFYKLIDQEGLSEQKRMHQLLIWCASRALLEKPRPDEGTSTIETIAIESARQIQDELIKDFSSKSELSNWFVKDDVPTPNLSKRPNPRNIKNEEKLKELEEEILRLEQEEASWKSLLSPKVESAKPEESESDFDSIEPSLLGESQKILLSFLDPSLHSESNNSKLQPSHEYSLHSLSQRIQTITQCLEPTIDSLADGVHRISQYSIAAGRVADRVTGVWARKLQARDEAARKEGGSADIGARDVLRALAGRLNEGPS